MLPLIVSGPSGVGKSTLLRQLFLEYQEHLRFSVSCTTRSPRKGEVHGVAYYFIQKSEFQRQVDSGSFAETAVNHGEWYGTLRSELQSTDGKVTVLDIDVQGVEQLWSKGVGGNYVFITPADLALMETRLRNRKSETAEQLQSRLNRAKDELAFLQSHRSRFTAVLPYACLETAYPAFLRILSPLYPFVHLDPTAPLKNPTAA